MAMRQQQGTCSFQAAKQDCVCLLTSAAAPAGGFGWRMSDDEVAALDAASAKVPETTGAPFEKW